MDGLTGKAAIFATALARGSSIVASGKEAGISERTARTWIKRQDIQAEVHRLRDRMADEAIGRLSRSLSAAAATLASLLATDKDDHIRLRAARAIIDSHIKINGYEELSERIRKLEESNYVPRPMEPGPPS